MQTVLPAGARFGRFEVVRELGSGGAGRVYLARSSGPDDLERSYAVKVLAPSPGARAALLDEARLLVGLRHSNVVQVLEIGREQELDFVVMELVDGMSLADLILRASAAATRTPAGVALHVGAEILKALHFVHGRTGSDGAPLGLVHRDVSPGNVLLSWAGEVKLADFGIARPARRRGETEPGVIKGTLGYLSPEQASGEGELDGRADVYAAAVVTYECLTGENPLIGDTDFDTFRRCLDPKFSPSSQAVAEAGPEVDAFFARALATGREDRFATAAEARAALQALPPLRALGTPDVALAEYLRRLGDERLVRSLSSAARQALLLSPGRATRPATVAAAKASRRLAGPALAAVILVLVLGAVLALARGPAGHAPAQPTAWPASAAPVSGPAPMTTAAAARAPADDSPPHHAARGSAPSASTRAQPRPPAREDPALPAPGVILPTPAARAVLRVNVDPWAEVIVDGQTLGEVPREATLAVGSHTLTLRNLPLGLEKTLLLSLSPGETRTISDWPP